MVKRERLKSHRLVEECMLAANEAVARFFHERQLPSVYRFHGEPDEDKLATFRTLAQAHGFNLPKGKITSQDLNVLLEQLEDHPEQRALNQLLLRSMMQAVYSSMQVGHYGLAAEHYLHFTSPIRRYPDLLVHRLLKALWSDERRGGQDVEREQAKLEDMAAHSSERERGAMQVEREVVAFYAALMMKDRVGEEFDATVSSVTDFGFFVQLNEELVEGLVKAESLGGNYRLDAALHALVYGSGRRVRVGQKLRVRLVSVNLQRRQLDFQAIAFEGEALLPEPEEGWQEAGRGGRRPQRSAPGRRQERDGRGGRPAGREERPAQGRGERFDRHGKAGTHERPGRGAGQGRFEREERVRRAPPPPQPWEQPEEAREEDLPSSSPHPGFDRLRALAAREGRLRSEPAARGKAPRGDGKPGASGKPSRGGGKAGRGGGGKPSRGGGGRRRR
jgi:ribonuclease R